jgi:excisionase family DNA binding protein
MTGSPLTPAEVAELLGVPRSWVYEQPRAGRIPTLTVGRHQASQVRLSKQHTGER